MEIPQLLTIQSQKCGLKLESGNYVEHKHDEPKMNTNDLDHDACLSDSCDDCSVEHNNPETAKNNTNLLIRLTNQKFRDEDIRLAVQKQVRIGASEFHKFSGVDEEFKIWEKH